MNMQEMTRFFLALRQIGLTDKEIVDLIIYIESGNEDYKPKKIITDR